MTLYRSPPFALSGSKITETMVERGDNVERLIEYLESKGLRAGQTRLGEYLRFLRRFLSGKCSDEEIKNKFLFVLREVDEWSLIYRGLMKSEPEGSLELLRLAIDGVAFARDEAINTQPRNIQLELRVASYFLQTGFSVSFKGTSDLVVDVDGMTVFVECKRLNSPIQVIKRSKEAVHQLRRSYQSSLKPSYGLVVLEASRVIHPLQGIVSGPTEEIVCDGLRTQLMNFDREHDTVAVFAKDKKLIAVWMQAMAPGYYTEGNERNQRNEPTTRITSFLSVYAKEGQRRWELFQKMKPTFSAI